MPARIFRWLREHVTADTIAGVIAPYRALFNPEFADPDAQAEAAATLSAPPIPTLYLHGANDGALGAEIARRAWPTICRQPGSSFELIDGVGHFLHLEQPDADRQRRICSWLAG